MTDRFDIELALDMLLNVHQMDQNSDPPQVVQLLDLIRERHNEVVDVLSDPVS